MNMFTQEMQEAIIMLALYGTAGAMAAYYFINDFLTYRRFDKTVTEMINDNEMSCSDKKTNLWWLLGNLTRCRGNSLIFRWGYDRVINKTFGFLFSANEKKEEEDTRRNIQLH